MVTNLHAVGAGLVNLFGVRVSDVLEGTRLRRKSDSVVAAAEKAYSRTPPEA